MLKNMRLVILSDMLVNPSFKMTTSFAKIARTTARIFLSLPNLQTKSLFMPVIETLSNFIWKKIVFNRAILSFVFCCTLRIYTLQWPASFLWPIKYCTTKYGLSLFSWNSSSLSQDMNLTHLEQIILKKPSLTAIKWK